jgi:hypothetical protein
MLYARGGLIQALGASYEDIMSNTNLHAIVAELNARSKAYDIGKLQELRKELKGLKHLPTRDIFTTLTTFDEWAFHRGGRKELQFNCGIEGDEIRFGVAFSFETSQSLPHVDVLIPKVKLFNDFIRLYPEKYADMWMWHYSKEARSSDYKPTSIPPELVTEGNFIFLGKRQRLANLDYESLLNELDRLLPLYQYVESEGSLPPISEIKKEPFKFRPGYRIAKATSAKVSQAQRELDVNLRHNILQESLCRRLSAKYGDKNVRDENPSGVGTKIDVVVRQNDEYWFYEIKTDDSPRACIRQALGQLLEYAFWPGTQVAARLIVVGEKALGEEGAKYLHTLRERFSLPIEYEQIVL